MTERRESDGRLSHRTAAPKAPPKVLKYDPIDMEIRGEEAPGSFGDIHRKALAKKSRDSNEPQALVLRHLEERVDPEKGLVNVPVKSYDEEKVSLARAGETILETFYGMFYACDDETKEWKLAVDGFIPLCFIQERGNANKPFKIIAVSGSVRLMEFSVTKDTKCAQNKAFVKWNESISNMFGVRFAKESQANQFYIALCRMKSTLIKTAELFKQPERKAMVSQISDPKVSSVPHSKTSLIVKLPNKETTVMSVPGLLTMSELFDLICKKESLNPQEHQLSLPRIGNKELTYESDTVLGSLKIREVSIIYVGVASDNGEASGGTSPVKVESLLEDENKKGKQLDIILPNGQQRSLLVPLNMPVRNLETYVCKKENLNPRHHSLQSNDFKHQCFDAGSAVGDIEFTELRLLDKRGHSSRSKLTKISSSDDSCVDSSQESLDLEGRNATRKDSKTSSNSDELTSISERSVKPPVPPQPYMSRSNASTKSNHELRVNELKSSQSFSEYKGKRTNPAVRELSLREAGKPKRKAPPPPRPPRPPQPSARPTKKEIDQSQPPVLPATEKVAAVGSSSSTPQGSPRLSPHQRHVKKRPAPARPPAPKPPSRQRSESNLSVEDTGAEGTKTNDRPPPVFCPPPPPDDEPPPLDECEHPVSPLSDDDLHETTWSSTFESPDVNGYPEELEHSSSIETGARERPVVATRRVKPERPKQPERPLPPLRPSSLPSTPTSPDPPERTVTSPESIPLKFLIPTPEKRPDSAADEQEDEHDEELSRICFDNDSRSSSVDISSFPESDMPLLSPVERYKPFPVGPPMEFAEKDTITVTNTRTLESAPEEPTLPPPLGFSKSESVELTTNLSISNDSGNVEYSGNESDATFEDMVVPPPPVLTDEELPQNDEEKPDSLSQIDVLNPIPPPMDFAPPPSEFANPPAEFADSEAMSPQPQKKKLGLNSSSFPWLAEPQPSFKAEIKDTQPDVQEEGTKSPVGLVPTEFRDEQTLEKSFSDEVEKTSSDLKIEDQMEYESSLAFEVPEPFIPDSQETLESEQFKISNLDSNKKDLSDEVTYKTPFDDMEDVSHAAEEPDEGFDDLPDPVFEASVSNNVQESKDSDDHNKDVGQYRLDLSETADLSPPTPPLTSPPGSGCVSPTLPSPLCSPREDTPPVPPAPAEVIPAKTEKEPREKITNNVISSSNYSSSNAMCSSEPIELPNPPPITVPPLRRYSDLAADISFPTSGIQTDSHEPPPKESEKNISSSSNKEESSQVKQPEPQAPSVYKRPTPGAFKTQSWADIKNREKELEEQRKKEKEQRQSNTRESPPASLVFRNLNRSSANAIRPKSWVAPSSKSFNPILPSMYKPPESTKQADNVTDAKIDTSRSTDSEKGLSSDPSPKTPETTASCDEKNKAFKKDAVEHKPVSIVPMSGAKDINAVGQSKDRPINIVPMPSTFDTKTVEQSKDKPINIVPMSDAKDTNAVGQTKDKPINIVPMSDAKDTNAVGQSKGKPINIVPMSSAKETKPDEPAKQVNIVPLSSTSEAKPEPAKHRPVNIIPLSSASEAKPEPAKHRPINIIHMSSTMDTENDAKEDKDSTSSSQSTTKVVMRKKADKPDLGEKRKSIQDMMSMFGDSKDSKRMSDDVTPQRSPAMRSLEEKVIGRSSKQYGISSLVDTLSSKPGEKDSKKESKAEDSSVKSAQDTKVKGAEGRNAQRVYKIILANDEVASSSSGKKEETKKEETKKGVPKVNDSRPRSNSLNPRDKYNVLFPKDESKETSKSSSSSQEKKNKKSTSPASSSSQTSTSEASVEAKKEEAKSAEPVVSLREKEATKPIDPFKRRSMPVYVVENNERPQPQTGSKLQILMAHQITDVGVVPRGRVAAMKAAWKKEGN
ncbi:titin-like isoform X2 [Actinia tenebrosa]|uniref:Titin-like isoform X2 n=1 Tax=Actinia tenebrosa TaxID=6105 RepID=A0A6P8IBI2_ACTTE|nr:titin-like isoform X2 [Actinia tenebrosa]